MFYLIGSVFITFVFGLALIIFRWATKNNDFFEKRGLPSMKPTLFFGNTSAFFFKKVELIEFVTNLYNAFPNEKLVFGKIN